MNEDLPFMPPAVRPRVQDLMDVNMRDPSQLAKIKARINAERSVVPQLDPMSAQDIPAWLHANKPAFPISPGSYGPQLLKDAERQFLPSPADSEDSATMKVQKALMLATMGSPGGSGPATLAAVKGKGGMWHPNAHEALSEPLYGNMVRGREHEIPAPGEGAIPGIVNSWETASPEGKWAVSAIKKYMNKHMGTAEDPLNNVPVNMIDHPGEAARWEAMSDRAIQTGKKAKDYTDGPKDYLSPLSKTPPDETVFTLNRYNADGSGETKALGNMMAHVGDHMRGVPVEELNRYDLVRAVQETVARDAARAKKMNSVEGRSEGTIPHKEYPDKFKWVEVKSKEALDREGDQMGHCVGDYCDYVESGLSKIYSLRDPKEHSHVTVEVRPFESTNQSVREYVATHPGEQVSDISKHPGYQAWLKEQPPTIHQIQGKENKTPKEVYQKYIQDFIKSGPLDHPNAGKTSLSKAEYEAGQRLPAWGDVHNLSNAGLYKHRTRGYYTKEEGLPIAIENIKRRLAEIESNPVKNIDVRQHATSYNKDQLQYNLKHLEAMVKGHPNYKEGSSNIAAMHFGVDLYDR